MFPLKRQENSSQQGGLSCFGKDSFYSSKDRKQMFENMFFKLHRYGLVSVSLYSSQVLILHKKYLQSILDMLRALKFPL